jgi:hypothetical protein
MIHHLVLCKLAPDVGEEQIEWMLRQTRSRLLKIPEVLQVRCGRNLDDGTEWPFFFSAEFLSTDQLAAYADHPVYGKFVEEVLRPMTTVCQSMDFEMEPGKDRRLS